MNKPEAPLAAANQTATHWEPTPNNLESFWMPFTPNRAFKKRPRLIARARDMHYYDMTGRAVLDGTAGLWCCNAGHCRPRIVEAIQRQAGELDFAPTFQFGHPKVFELAGRLAALAPGNLDHAFFTNSGSEATDTALKIALAYHRVRGEASRTRLIGRNSAVLTIGLASMPLLSGAVTQAAGWRAAFAIYTVALGTAAAAWYTLETRRHRLDPPERFPHGLHAPGSDLEESLRPSTALRRWRARCGSCALPWRPLPRRPSWARSQRRGGVSSLSVVAWRSPSSRGRR